MSEEKKKLGIDQIKKVLDVLVEGGNVADKVSQAASTMAKIVALLPLSDELLSLMSLSPALLRAQYKDLDEKEKEALREHARKKFDIKDDDLESKLELGLDLVGETLELFERVISFAKSIKKKG